MVMADLLDSRTCVVLQDDPLTLPNIQQSPLMVSSAQINQETLICDAGSVADGPKDVLNSAMEAAGQEGLATASSAFLEAKKKKLLKQLEIRYQHHIDNVIDFETSTTVEGSTNIKELGGEGFENNRNVETQTYSAHTDGTEEEHQKMVENDGKKMGDLQGNEGLGRCSLKIDLVDDTALIETVLVTPSGNGREKKERFVGSAKDTETKVNKTVKQEQDEKKAKQSRRAKCMKTNVTQITAAQIGCQEYGDGAKRTYSRRIMEVLRFSMIVEQRKLWKKIYNGLGFTVVSEYDALVSTKHQKNTRLNCDPRQCIGKKELPAGVLREACAEDLDSVLDSMQNDETETVNLVESGCEESDSDEDHASIQRPAFMVEGNPNFDSGPPEDGLEYLRRVRWEAAQIPKVKVAKIDRSRFTEEQSAYMPKIPDIAKCPGDLLPSKCWEDSFLSDFADMRQAFEGYITNIGELQSTCINEKDDSRQHPETILLENFAGLEIEENSINPEALFLNSEATETSLSPEKWIPEACVSESSSGNYPTLNAIVGMKSVARASMLRKRILSLDTRSSLSRNDCVWLYALCVAIDTPADSDTCAALRTLLRRCASMRAEKSQVDDEVVMLNILATISGRYFGQLEK